jgi:uncharacterized protein YqgV (UPF0045/DUF77 family)
METTIQINVKTLLLLKKLKQQVQAKSYDETINKIVVQRANRKTKSMGGSLKKYLKKEKTPQKILKELQEERRKSDRF